LKAPIRGGSADVAVDELLLTLGARGQPGAPGAPFNLPTHAMQAPNGSEPGRVVRDSVHGAWIEVEGSVYPAEAGFNNRPRKLVGV
jgi:hypothetical protein